MESEVNQSNIIKHEESNLPTELLDLKQVHCTRTDEIFTSNQNNLKADGDFSNFSTKCNSHEYEDSSNVENEQFQQQLSSVAKFSHKLQENERRLKEELEALKEQNKSLRINLTESNAARDNVIKKLRDVSIETKELINTCEKSSEETNLFRIKSEELEIELNSLFQENEALKVKNNALRIENDSLKEEILNLMKNNQLRENVNESCDKSTNYISNISDIINNINDTELQIRNLIDRYNESCSEKSILSERIKSLEMRNLILKETNKEKDSYLSKQNKDFNDLKIRVDDYHSEILRLDNELKDCRQKVVSLNESLETLNVNNFDIIEYNKFKVFYEKFGNMENIENILYQMKMLQEIEHFFVTKLSSHFDTSNGNKDENHDTILPDKTVNVIQKIQMYLEKALSAIEKLNNKIDFLKTDYENKLQRKNDEISTLREVLSNASLYNKILEQTLQQFKNNTQLDKSIESKIDELVIVNKTLLDGFDEVRNLYQKSEQRVNFFYTKFMQLCIFMKILKINLQKSFEIYDKNFSLLYKTESNKNMSLINQKLCKLFYLIDEIIDEVHGNTNSIEISSECQKLLDDCQKNLATKDYLKNSVENMSLEVKRLTCKVEQEMAEKIREIELLKGEMDSMKADNRELVNKIKSCNHEIISLSAENYDLNEKLVHMDKTVKNVYSFDVNNAVQNNNLLLSKTEDITRCCASLKSENKNLKQLVVAFKEEFNTNLALSLSNISNLKNADNCELKTKICNLNKTCSRIKAENENLKNINFSQLFENIFSSARSTLLDKLQCINNDFHKLEIDLNDALNKNCEYKNNISQIAVVIKQLKVTKNTLHAFVKKLPAEFSKFCELVMQQIQITVVNTFGSIKESLALSNEEMLKEMQDMNLELKKRGEIISILNQSISNLEKESKLMNEKLTEKENSVYELVNKLSNYEKKIQANEIDLKKLQERIQEFENDSKNIEELQSKINNLQTELKSKENTIALLENEIARHKEIQDGDVSSMGNISRTEEVSRMKDIEESFEDRYIKLRVLAVKMKKNISELNQQLKTERAERTSLQNKLSLISEETKRSQALQDECDKLADEIELKSSEIKELKKIIAESDKSNENLKIQCSELGETANALLKENALYQTEKNEFEMRINDLHSRVEQLTKEINVEIMLKKEKEKEIQNLKRKLTDMDQVYKKTINELEQTKLEARKHGALTLEMRDYQKTISDLTLEIQEKQVEFDELSKEHELCKYTHDSLKDQIREIEEKFSSSLASNSIADAQILNLNKLINRSEQELEAQKQRVRDIMQQLENEKSKNESLTLQLSDSSAKLVLYKDETVRKQETLQQQVKLSQEKIAELEKRLKKQTNEYEKLNDNFETYKIRAHSLLEKHKNENNLKSNEENLKQEIQNLTQTVTDLRKILEKTSEEMELEKTKYTFMENTKENLEVKVKELSDSLNDKTKELINVQMECKHKLSASESLVKSYKADIEKLKNHVADLKINLISSVNNAEKENIVLNLVADRNIQMTPNFDNSFLLMSQDIKNNIGNEITEDKNISDNIHRHSLMPLDKLLENDIDENTPFTSQNTNELQQKIRSLEKQVRYLSRILNESEKNAARNEQQVTLLKDEIKRLQRAVEREPHLQNNEYVKNVLLKFVCLPNGDERSSLVNVLETILKLTSDEKKMLTSVAQGYRTDQKSNTGWTSFLGWS